MTASTPVASPIAAAPKTGDEKQLVAYLEQFPESRLGLRALWFRLSRLGAAQHRGKYVQITTNVVEQALLSSSRRLFLLRDNDVVVISKGISRKLVDKMTEVLRYLFNDDPLAREQTQRPDFCASFDLEVEYAGFQNALLDAMRGAPAPAPAPREAAPEKAAPPGKTPLPDLHDWGKLVGAMDRVDLAGLVRRQAVWGMLPGRPAKRVFDELFISIAELRKALGPMCNLLADRQVFQLATRRLDKHVLETLVRDHSDGARRVSINVNLATLTSTTFAEFESKLPVGWRDRLILEIQLADMLTDVAAFVAFARHAEKRGYICCLDGVVHNALPFINFKRVQVPFVKLTWDAAIADLDAGAMDELRGGIAECNPERIILTRCGEKQAIEFGQSIGIALFQGWYPDRNGHG